MTCLVEEGKLMKVVYLDFSKSFDFVFQSYLQEKLAAHDLDRYSLLFGSSFQQRNIHYNILKTGRLLDNQNKIDLYFYT